RHLKIYISVLAGVAAFAGLVKITLLVLGSLTLAVISACLILRGYGLLSLTLPALALVGFIGGWMGLGQKLLNLGTFLERALITSQGYNSAMGYEGSVLLRGRALLTSFFAISAILAAANPLNLKLTRNARKNTIPIVSRKEGEPPEMNKSLASPIIT